MLKMKSSVQSELEFVSIDELVPQDHLLRKIDAAIDFTFIYDKVEQPPLAKGTANINRIPPPAATALCYLNVQQAKIRPALSPATSGKIIGNRSMSIDTNTEAKPYINGEKKPSNGASQMPKSSINIVTPHFAA